MARGFDPIDEPTERPGCPEFAEILRHATDEESARMHAIVKIVVARPDITDNLQPLWADLIDGVRARIEDGTAVRRVSRYDEVQQPHPMSAINTQLLDKDALAWIRDQVDIDAPAIDDADASQDERAQHPYRPFPVTVKAYEAMRIARPIAEQAQRENVPAPVARSDARRLAERSAIRKSQGRTT